MEIVVVAVLIGLIPAAIAQGKGHSFLAWWVFGAFLFIIALPLAILLKPNTATVEAMQAGEGMRECPHCAEMIKREAKVCRYCGRESPPLTFYNGRWWTQRESGWYWWDESHKEWMAHPAAPEPTPAESKGG
jgi:hypothetical protein